MASMIPLNNAVEAITITYSDGTTVSLLVREISVSFDVLVGMPEVTIVGFLPHEHSHHVRYAGMIDPFTYNESRRIERICARCLTTNIGYATVCTECGSSL